MVREVGNLDARMSLAGKDVRLVPLSHGHAAALAEIAQPDIFTYIPLRPQAQTHQAVVGYIDKILEDQERRAFAIVLAATNRAIGSTSYLNIRPEHRRLEIGATWIGRAYQGTRVNPESKYLLLRHAFETFGAVRVQLRCDRRNAHSRRAIEKLGARPEGVLRKHMILPDGYVRDTVVYSILDEEWPEVRAALERRLRYAP